MFITRECDYAVRIVRALGDGEKHAVKEICEAEHVPQPYAYKIMKKLEEGGVVTSHRGAHGGYTLAKPLEELNLYDILSSIEEQMYLNECMAEGYTCPNNHEGNLCQIHIELDRIQNDLIEHMRSRNMAEILAG